MVEIVGVSAVHEEQGSGDRPDPADQGRARSEDPPLGGSPIFVTTRWSLVLSAGDPTDPARHAALEQFCKDYWFPLYAFTRRQGFDAHQSQDLVQSFFLRLLERNDLAGLTPGGARFRSFLLKVLTRFLINERERAGALKRGSGKLQISIDQEAVEGRYLHELELAHTETPDRIFEREWALALLESAVRSLESEQKAAGKEALWREIRPFLSREPQSGEYAAAADRLGMQPGSLGVAVHRLRQRYRDRVREAVAATVESPLEVDNEMRHLLASLE